MRNLLGIAICVLVVVGAGVEAATNAAELDTLRDPGCLPVEMLVELPILQKDYFDLSTTHAYVRRCLGVNDKKKACRTKDEPEKIEEWKVVKTPKGSDKEEFVHVSWVTHEKCQYERRKKCPIADAEKCHEKSDTHYYNEVKCSCDCIIQIEGKDTCDALVSKASGTIIWLPILTFLLGVVISAVFVYFRIQHSKKLSKDIDYGAPIDRKSSTIGFAEVEQPAEPPTPPVNVDEKDGQKIGFNI